MNEIIEALRNAVKSIDEYGEIFPHNVEEMRKALNSDINQKFEGEVETAIDFFALKNGGKTPMEMAEDGEMISPVWAASLMERYAAYLLTDKDD